MTLSEDLPGGWLGSEGAFLQRGASSRAGSPDAFVSLDRDDRTLSVENEILDSDVRLMELEGGPR